MIKLPAFHSCLATSKPLRSSQNIFFCTFYWFNEICRIKWSCKKIFPFLTPPSICAIAIHSSFSIGSSGASRAIFPFARRKRPCSPSRLATLFRVRSCKSVHLPVHMNTIVRYTSPSSTFATVWTHAQFFRAHFCRHFTFSFFSPLIQCIESQMNIRAGSSPEWILFLPTLQQHQQPEQGSCSFPDTKRCNSWMSWEFK